MVIQPGAGQVKTTTTSNPCVSRPRPVTWAFIHGRRIRVDLVVLTVRDGELCALLVRRGTLWGSKTLPGQ
jgi:hypothetical protein